MFEEAVVVAAVAGQAVVVVAAWIVRGVTEVRTVTP